MRDRLLPVLSSRIGVSLLLLLVPATGCVTTAEYRAAVAEKERVQRENLELRRSLAEARVRADEAVEASSGTASVARGAGSAESRPGPEGGGVAPAAVAPEGLRGPAATISDEDVRGPESAVPPAAGADGLLRAARSYVGAGKRREAVDVFTRLISDFPFSPLLADAFFERGSARLSLGDRHGALEDFDTVSEAFPASPRAAEARRQASLLRH
ncbi:MAG TPA: tetratricopeptide repeat protein [Verrucomicrobiae bacterium]|nr:tetratricopeptide repeat protein [Verrucomicrobiae bacterium]